MCGCRENQLEAYLYRVRLGKHFKPSLSVGLVCQILLSESDLRRNQFLDKLWMLNYFPSTFLVRIPHPFHKGRLIFNLLSKPLLYSTLKFSSQIKCTFRMRAPFSK